MADTVVHKWWVTGQPDGGYPPYDVSFDTEDRARHFIDRCTKEWADVALTHEVVVTRRSRICIAPTEYAVVVASSDCPDDEVRVNVVPQPDRATAQVEAARVQGAPRRIGRTEADVIHRAPDGTWHEEDCEPHWRLDSGDDGTEEM